MLNATPPLKANCLGCRKLRTSVLLGLQISSLIQQLGFYPMHVKTTKTKTATPNSNVSSTSLPVQKERKFELLLLCSGEAKVERRAGRGGQKPVFATLLSGRGAHFRKPGSGRETGPSFRISIWRPEIGRPGLIGLIGIWIQNIFFFFLSFFFPSFFFSFCPFQPK